MKRGALLVLAALVVVVLLVWRSEGPPPAPSPELQAMPRTSATEPPPAPIATAATQPAAASPAPHRAAALPQSPPTAAVPPRPAPPPAAAAAPVVPDIEIEEVHTTIRDYRLQFDGNPVGTNAEITTALAGDNPKHTDFLTGRDFRRNGNGELVDRWGTPYFFHQISADIMEVRSAGPDRVMWTEDDRSM